MDAGDSRGAYALAVVRRRVAARGGGRELEVDCGDGVCARRACGDGLGWRAAEL